MEQFIANTVVTTKQRCKKLWNDLTFREMSGALGDLGTFLPLIVALTKAMQLDLGTTLLFTGVYNIVTGVLFDIPMPVQPMKTIAAIALSQTPLTIPQIMAAGIFVSATVFVLGVTRLIKMAVILMPIPVIRGMQLGLGIQLASKGFQMVWYQNSKSGAIRQWWTPEGLFLGLFSLVFIGMTIYPRGKKRKTNTLVADITDNIADVEAGCDLSSTSHQSVPKEEEIKPTTSSVEKQKTMRTDSDDTHDVVSSSEGESPRVVVKVAVCNIRTPLLVRKLHSLGAKAESTCNDGNVDSIHSGPMIPTALLLVITGIVITMVSYPAVVDSLSFGPSTPQVVVPAASDWKTGILSAGLPQLALTIFNSVVSVCALAHELFPDNKSTTTVSVATSVGSMNLVGCWFGAMPSCHGAGGLAGQVRFGARSGAAPIFLGAVKIFLSLLFGSSLFQLFQKFPTPILGAMLVFAGMELGAVARGQSGTRGMALMLFTAAVVIGVSNVAIGVAAGLIAAYLLVLRDTSLDFLYRYTTV